MNQEGKTPHIGRPSIPDEKKRKKTGFSLPPDLAQAVRDMAERRGVTISKIVEDALMKAIAEHHLKRE